MKRVLRSNPDMILVGEIRGYDSLKVAVTAAMSGHLVVTTLHASDIESALFRCASWLGSDLAIGNPWGLLSEALSGIFHLTMKVQEDKEPPIVIKTSSLWVDESGMNNSRQVRDALRKGELSIIKTEINNQARFFGLN